MDNGHELLLAVIFNPTKDLSKLVVTSFGIAEYDDKDCVIRSGEFKGFSHHHFNFQGEGAEELFESSRVQRLYTSSEYREHWGYLLLFGTDYIKKVASEKNISFNQACFDIANQASNIQLIPPSKLNELKENTFYKFKIVNNSDSPKFDFWELTNMLMYDPNESIHEINKDWQKYIANNNKPKEFSDIIKEMPNPISRLSEKQRANIEEIIKEIGSKIVGQEQAIVSVLTTVFYNQDLIDELSQKEEMDLAELDSRKLGLLIDGTTGTGKSAILNSVASKLDIPICVTNAASYSETGYYGPSITDILRKLYNLAGRNLEKAERGIVVMDEVDKLASHDDYNGKDMKKGVQDELLGFMSGGVYDFPLVENDLRSPIIHFDTSKLTFILGGAFTKLKEKKFKEYEKEQKSIGFERKGASNETYTVTTQDYIDYGLAREFFGRVKVLTYTNTYHYEEFYNILMYSEISPLKNIRKTVKMYGYRDITYTDDFIDEVCKKAEEMETGARGLQTIMAGVQNRLLRGLMNGYYDKDKPIELTTQLLDEYNMSLVRKF